MPSLYWNVLASRGAAPRPHQRSRPAVRGSADEVQASDSLQQRQRPLSVVHHRRRKVTSPWQHYAWDPIDDRAVDTARILAADAVEKVGNGHPGTAMSLAPAAYLLFQKVMRRDPSDTTGSAATGSSSRPATAR